MIIDCFAFFNELDLLEIRLETLAPVVDEFVLVEGTRTFSGRRKPLYFKEYQCRFSAHRHKIRHVVVDRWPIIFDRYHYRGKKDLMMRLLRLKFLPAVDPQGMDHYQKEHILRGLDGASHTDRVIISDVDEIPNPEAVTRHSTTTDVVLLQMQAHQYYLNCRQKKSGMAPPLYETRDGWVFWNAAVMLTYGDLLRIGSVRSVRKEGYHKGIYEKMVIEADGGWHWSFLGGAQAVRHKLESYSHPEYNDPRYTEMQRLATVIDTGGDLLGRGDEFAFVPINSNYPEYIRMRQQDFTDRGLIKPLV